MQEGLSEASVLIRKIQSFSDPRLYALSVVAQNLANCTQPLVPERVFIAGGTGSGGAGGDGQSGIGAGVGNGLVGMLLSLLVAEKSGFQLADTSASSELEAFSEKVTRQAMDAIEQAVLSTKNGEASDHPGNGAVTATKTVVPPSRIANSESHPAAVAGA